MMEDGWHELVCRYCSKIYAAHDPHMPEIEFPVCPSCRKEEPKQ